jgi:UDP-N-acetylglucosamine--N-acetylmuramyl-(pentapeptide) pyrophosphoryl-undecaprenol N-acetylglucosamine transferase
MSVNGRSNREAEIASLAAQLASAFEFVAEDADRREPVTILAAAGGTGGHIVPALEVARELRSRGHHCVFVGAGRELERRLTSAAGFPLETLRSGPLNQVSLATKITTLLRLPGALLEAWRLISLYRPAAVLSLGGYAAAPLAAAAWMRGIPIVALEPNAYPGMANRVIAPVSARALTGIQETEKYFRRSRTETIGAPVRKEFFEIPIKKHTEPFMILVTGGSQGARTLNRAAAEAVRFWARNGASQSLRVVHQAGKADAGRLQLEYASVGSGSAQAEAVEFLDDMPAAFAQADVVISRAGASTVGELCAAGRASILIPYPHAADDHQTRNAEALAAVGGAVVVSDAEWNGERMVREIESLLSVPGRMERMEQAARSLSRPGAARRAADVLEEVAGRDGRKEA